MREQLTAELGAWPSFRPTTLALAQDCRITRHVVLRVLGSLGLYVLPTAGLVAWLKAQVGDERCLEIGAGSGWLARELGWSACDSRLHLHPLVKTTAVLAGLPEPLPPPPEVLHEDALECARRLKPSVVVGLYISHRYDPASRTGVLGGVDDLELFRLPSVRRYILIGDAVTHCDRPLMRKQHLTLRAPPWLSIRGSAPRVWIWCKP